MISWLQFNKCCQTVYRQQFTNACQLLKINKHAAGYRMLQHNAVQATKEENDLMKTLKSRIYKMGYIPHSAFAGTVSTMKNNGGFEQDEALFLIDCCRKSLVGLDFENTTSIRIDLGHNIVSTTSNKTTQVYNALIQLYIENGHKFSPEQMLEDMINNGVSPDASTYSKLVCAHCINGELKASENLIERMKEKDFPVSDEVLSYLLVGKLKTGENVDGFLNRPIELSDHIFALLCCQFCRLGDVEMLRKFLSFISTEQKEFLDGYHFVDIVHASLSSGNPAMMDEILPFLNKNPTTQEIGYMVQSLDGIKGSGQVLKNLLKYFSNLPNNHYKAFIKSIYKSSSADNLMDEVQYLQNNMTNREVVLTEALRHACENEPSLSKTVLLEMKRQNMDMKSSFVFPVYTCSKEGPEEFNQFLSENSIDEHLLIPSKIRNPVDVVHWYKLTNKNLNETAKLVDTAISFLQSRKNTIEIAETVMAMRSEFGGPEESFDKTVLDALVKKLNSMPYMSESWCDKRLKKFMMELRELGFNPVQNQHGHIHKSLVGKYRYLSNVLLLDGDKLVNWTPARNESSIDKQLSNRNNKIRNPVDVVRRYKLTNKEDLKETATLVDTAISFLQSKKNTTEIAEAVMAMRSEFCGPKESFDKTVLDALVKKLNSMPYISMDWFNTRLKKFMMEVRELGFKPVGNQHNHIHKSLVTKYHHLSNVLLLDGEKLANWTPSFPNRLINSIHEFILAGNLESLTDSITKHVSKIDDPVLQNKYLACIVQDSLLHLEGDDRTTLFKQLLDGCSSPLPADISNVMLWHFIELGDSETVAQIHSSDRNLARTLRRFYDISYIPNNLLLSENEHVQTALRQHLTTIYTENKADWLYYASFLLSGNIDQCPKELIERLEWPGSLFYQSLFISPSVLDFLPEFIHNITEVCSRFEKFSVGELVIQSFASLFRRDMLIEAERLVESLAKKDFEITGKLKVAITEKFLKADRKLPESFQVSKTARSIEEFTRGGQNFLEILLLVLNPPPSSGEIPLPIINNFFEKLLPGQLDVVDNVLKRSNSKLDPYIHPNVLSARLAVLLDQKRYEECFALLGAKAKKVKSENNNEYWASIISMFGKHAIAENDMSLVKNLFKANLIHGVRDRANNQLTYCKLKTSSLPVDEFLQEGNFSQFRELTEIIVFENDADLITQLYKGGWSSYEEKGIAKPLFDFTAGLLANGFTDSCLVEQLGRMQDTCGVSLHVFGKSMMRAKDFKSFTHICSLMEQFPLVSATEQAVLNHQLVRACLHLSTTLNRADKRQLLGLLDTALYRVPHYYNLKETRVALPVLRHCLKFDVAPEGIDRVGIEVPHVQVNKNPLFN